jgi:gamma-glutamyl:cysteine ligase YbdK (ATP-grasp superfamily)
MGREIDREGFDAADRARFDARLRRCLTALGATLATPGFGEGETTIGAEVEMSLVDERGLPAGRNEAVRDALGSADVSLELGRSSIEASLAPSPLAGRPFTHMAEECRAAVGRIDGAARNHGASAVMIGTLPTLSMADLQGHGLTGSARYRAMSGALDTLKPGNRIAIEGEERLDVEVPGIVAESASAALHLHLRVAPGQFARTFNAAMLAAGPALAIAVNSPLLFGHVLWEETRVPLFHQAVDGRAEDARGRPGRVTFGSGWVRHGALELFAESVALHEPILPLSAPAGERTSDGPGAPSLDELLLHHGTTWPWTRAVYDPADGGHLRVEMRALPAGPSVADMAASAAFMVGLTLFLATDGPPLEAMPFACAHGNFLAAARHGLDASLLWPAPEAPSPRPVPAAHLVGRLLDDAREGLVDAGVDAAEADEHLAVLRGRLATGMTGAAWQRAALRETEPRMMRGEALAAVLDTYISHQREGSPVHTWPAPIASRAA